jgi:seryl-tRNA synthetase
MPVKLPENVRSLVIQQWLGGKQRDEIAVDNGLSAGAVTNIVNSWRQALGFAAADELRDLAVTLKKVDITPAQCAVGFRVAMMMNRLGIKEDSFESFMSDGYNHCKNLGLTPENIASYLTDLLQFSKSVPISDIPHYIEQKKQEKKKLEEEIERLKEQKEDLEAQKSAAEDLREATLHAEEMTTARLRWYSGIKRELRRYGIPVDDISQLAKVVGGIKQYGYDTKKVLNEFSNLESLKVQYQSYQDGIEFLKNNYDGLTKDCSSLQQMVSLYNRRLTTYQELETMGFGLKELKFLRNTIREIAGANNIPLDTAVQKFFKDIDEQYDDKLGLESKIDKLRTEVNRLIQEEARLRMQLSILPSIGPLLMILIQRGVSEQDIVDIAELLKNDANITSSNSKGSIGIEEIRLLIAELRTYGSIKSSIRQLSQKVDKLRNQIGSLRTEKQDLNAQNQTMFFTLQNLKQLIGFFSGSFVSLSSQIISLVSIMAYTIYLLNIEVERLQKSQDDSSNHPPSCEDEFVSLTMAARGDDVELPKLKVAVIKAIELTLEKLKGKDKEMTTEILSRARLALENEQF